MSLVNDLDGTKFGKMILTPLIDIDNLSTFRTFVVIDDKGGEKQREGGERNKDRGEI